MGFCQQICIHVQAHQTTNKKHPNRLGPCYQFRPRCEGKPKPKQNLKIRWCGVAELQFVVHPHWISMHFRCEIWIASGCSLSRLKSNQIKWIWHLVDQFCSLQWNLQRPAIVSKTKKWQHLADSVCYHRKHFRLWHPSIPHRHWLEAPWGAEFHQS